MLGKRLPNQKLTLRIPLRAANAVGTFSRTLTLKLPGQKQRQRRRR